MMIWSIISVALRAQHRRNWLWVMVVLSARESQRCSDEAPSQPICIKYLIVTSLIQYTHRKHSHMNLTLYVFFVYYRMCIDIRYQRHTHNYTYTHTHTDTTLTYTQHSNTHTQTTLTYTPHSDTTTFTNTIVFKSPLPFIHT